MACIVLWSSVLSALNHNRHLVLVTVWRQRSIGPQKESGSVVDWRQPGKELWKRKWRTWTTDGASSRGWPVTDRGGGASLLPSTPAGVTGSDGDDCMKIWVRPHMPSFSQIQWACYKKKWKVGWESRTGMPQYSPSTIEDSCECTLTDMPVLRTMTELVG